MDNEIKRLRAIYDEVDALVRGWSCDVSTECCHFGVTGREPYPTAVELAELERAVRARGGLPKRRALPVLNAKGKDAGRCGLLSDDGKCAVYASRPFGCRTFYCERAHGPAWERTPPRDEFARLSRAIADLAFAFAPTDPGPRPLSKAIAAWGANGERLVRGGSRATRR